MAATKRVAEENPEPLNINGTNRYATDTYQQAREKTVISDPALAVINSEIITPSTGSEIGERGTSAAYRVRRLRRDHPEIAARLDRGEFRSVAAAERVAEGLPANPPRKVPSPLEQAKKLVARMTGEELAELIRLARDALTGRSET